MEALSCFRVFDSHCVFLLHGKGGRGFYFKLYFHNRCSLIARRMNFLFKSCDLTILIVFFAWESGEVEERIAITQIEETMIDCN